MLAVAASSVPSLKVVLVGQLSQSAAVAASGAVVRARAMNRGVGRMGGSCLNKGGAEQQRPRTANLWGLSP